MNRLQIGALALVAFVLVFLFWQTGSDLLYPFRLLVTFVHETGHGLAAVVSGGSFEEFKVFPNGAGVASTRGGNALLILPMGYLGAALFGAVLLVAANRMENVKLVAVAVGLFFIACAILFTQSGVRAALVPGMMIGIWVLSRIFKDLRPYLLVLAIPATIITLIIIGGDLALTVGLIAGTFFLALAIYAGRLVILFVLNALAFLIGFNAVNDVQVLFNNQSIGLGNTPNDALALARLTGTPTILWVLLWLGTAVGLLGLAAYWSFFRRRNAR